MSITTEVEQLVVVSISAGFLSGILSVVIADILGALTKNKKIEFKNSVSKSLLGGLTMAILLTTLIFVLYFMSVISTRELTQYTIGFAIIIMFIPIFTDLLVMFFSKIFSQSHN